jgi:hypothetical protein
MLTPHGHQNTTPNFTLSTILGTPNLSKPGTTLALSYRLVSCCVRNEENLLKLVEFLLYMLGKQVHILVNHFL